MIVAPSAEVRRGVRPWIADPRTYRSRPLSPWWQASMAALAVWSLTTDMPGL